MDPKRIIVKMPNWLGDLVMATPILADLKKRWPEAEITAMCQSKVAPLLKYDPHVHELLSYEKPNGWIPHRPHWVIINEIRKGNYDLGILLTNSFSSAWWFCLARVKYRLGFKGNLRSWLLSKAVAFPAEKETQHLVKTYKALLAPLEIPLSDTKPRLYISSEEQAAAQLFLKGCGIDMKKNKIIGINPGAAYGSAKCWPPDRYRRVAEKLLEDPQNFVLFFGDNTGADMVNAICADLSTRAINMAGKTTLRELLALINSCNAFLTNDSGPMHIAAALDVPLLALFGSTSEVKTGPYQTGMVIHKHVECSPCYKRVCPIDFRCMMRIEVDEVYQKLTALINQKQ